MKIISDDVDGKGNDIDVFWQDFEIEAKARGSMLLLVDMPSSMPQDGESQLSERAAPYWTSIVPERVSDYLLGDDGKFIFVEFSGSYIKADGEPVSVTWHFDRTMWAVFENDDRGERKVIDDDIHGLSECPVLIFTERGEFPCIGSFASIAYLSRRLFNLNSELDEILRGQTFSLLTMQVRDDISEEEKLNIAKTTGETVGTSNMMMHTGSTPAFIAPPDGPARVYLDRIDKMEQRIDSAGLSPSGSNAQESGYALQMRFAAINAELSRFAGRMEDLERRAWSLSAEWLGLAEQADIAWPRDFNIADSEQELLILQQMQASAMPGSTIRQQQRRVVVTQFNGADDDAISEMVNDINNQESML